jgi:Putative Na+/H+ antiporter
MTPTNLQIIGTILFALAIIHTFSTRLFARLAIRQPKLAGLWHLLSEVEIVFGFWASILILFMLVMQGRQSATVYLGSLSFTEPIFVFAIMVIAASRPILQLAAAGVRLLGSFFPLGRPAGTFFCVLFLLPLLGSFITEPAAMTVAALVLRDTFFDKWLSARSKYVAIGVLFVNISIGGTLTPYAAPPVLMVVGKWGWTLDMMLAQFGWKAALAVTINALFATFVCFKELKQANTELVREQNTAPIWVAAIHILFLCGVVLFGHTISIFMGIFLLFLGFAWAYSKYQDRLMLREGCLVAFFLAGLVVLGGVQTWWLQPLLVGMNETAVYFGAICLTAFTDNAALTYLGSLVEGTSDGFRYYLVAGAVVGGGLTVIANAPNPAGFSILQKHFPDGSISPIRLFLAAIIPTLVAMLAFWML